MAARYDIPCGRVDGLPTPCSDRYGLCSACVEVKSLRDRLGAQVRRNEFTDRYAPDVKVRSDKPGDEHLAPGIVRVEIRYEGSCWRSDISTRYTVTGKELMLEEAAIKAFRMSLKGMMTP